MATGAETKEVEMLRDRRCQVRAFSGRSYCRHLKSSWAEDSFLGAELGVKGGVLGE